jgi:integrase
MGRVLEPRNVVRSFKAALTRAKLPATVRFHDLRHSCAALLIAQGVHSRTVMETLGHSDIRVTMNTYGHVFEAAKHEAAAKMDALLAGGA